MFEIPETTDGRLRVVADIIEMMPERYNQDMWIDKRTMKSLFGDGYSPYSDEIIEKVTGTGLQDCGTTCCIAGWAVHFSPNDLLKGIEEWEDAGEKALGLERVLARTVFHHTFGSHVPWGERPVTVAKFLRYLADLPEDKRTMDFVSDDIPDNLRILDPAFGD